MPAHLTNFEPIRHSYNRNTRHKQQNTKAMRQQQRHDKNRAKTITTIQQKCLSLFMRRAQFLCAHENVCHVIMCVQRNAINAR